MSCQKRIELLGLGLNSPRKRPESFPLIMMKRHKRFWRGILRAISATLATRLSCTRLWLRRKFGLLPQLRLKKKKTLPFSVSSIMRQLFEVGAFLFLCKNRAMDNQIQWLLQEKYGGKMTPEAEH